MKTIIKVTLIVIVWMYAAVGYTQELPRIRVYLDADRTGTRQSGISIERGIRTALSEVDNKIAGHEVELVIKDHRGNTRRSKKHLKEYLQDERALAVFSGLHSPPLLANREFINTNGILVLDPWAAAGPITRYPSEENWIFRLSVDDTKAGDVISRYAVQKCGYSKPALLLENTGWGKSNKKTITNTLAQLNIMPTVTVWFQWNVSEERARIHLRTISISGADVIFFVGNAPEGKTFAKAMVSLPEEQHLPICSHWGITGGDFPSVIGPDIREKLSLTFIQTSFSFVSNPSDAFGRKVLERAKGLFPDIKGPIDIKAPAGFIHAYDLTKLFIAAVEKAGLTGNITEDRTRVRATLEKLEEPIQGLVKTYQRPFSVFSAHNPDAHEALTKEDFVMARYGTQGEIIVMKIKESE